MVGPLKFHGHIAPGTTGPRLSHANPNKTKLQMRLKTAGGTEENSNSASRLDKTTSRFISTAVDYNNIQSLNAVYQNVIK
jgi:hypothetical protein